MRTLTALLTIALLVCLIGCEEPAATSSAGSSAPAPTSAPTPSSAPVPGAVAAEEEDDEEEVERQVAEVGVGKKGRNYGGGVVSEPIRAMFRTEQRMQLLQVRQALDLYKASNGYFPKTHEVFIKDIIEVNSIQLPELPDGERYVYDPETSELMVERPRK